MYTSDRGPRATTGPYDGTVHYARTKRGQVVLAEHLHCPGVFYRCARHAPRWVNTPQYVGNANLSPPDETYSAHPVPGADTVVWLSCVGDSNIDKTNGSLTDTACQPTHLNEPCTTPRRKLHLSKRQKPRSAGPKHPEHLKTLRLFKRVPW